MNTKEIYLEIVKIENEEMAYEFLKETGIACTVEDVIGDYSCLYPESGIKQLPSGDKISLKKLKIMYFCGSDVYDKLVTVLIIDNKMYVLSDDWFNL